MVDRLQTKSDRAFSFINRVEEYINSIEGDELRDFAIRMKRAKDNPNKHLEDFQIWCELELLKIKNFKKEIL